MHEKNFNNDFAAAEIDLQTAIELDEGFAMATAEYAIQTLQQFRTEEGLALLEKVKIYNYKLTDSLKFSLATIEAIYSDQPEVARGIVNQWLALYPDSVDALELKVNLHSMFAERLLAIETLRKIIELEPFGTIRHLTIGRIFTSMGDIESAIEEYQLFLDNNPTNAQALMLIGDANRTLGNFDKARNQYNKAKLLLTNDLSADRRLSNILMRSGDFNQAEKNIKAYLDTSKSADENYTSWKEIVEYYWLRGQYSEAILALKNSHQVLKSYQAETTYYMLRSHDAWRFIKAGYPEEAKQIIADAKLLSDKGGRIYTANVMIAEARLDGYNNQTEQALNSVDEVSKSLAKMLGKGVDYQIYLFKGLIQFEGKLYQQAYENLERYLNTNQTDNNDIKVAKGISLLNIGNISQAQETFEEILKEYPSHPLANLEMAKIEMNYEKPESAKRYIKKALKAWEPADSNFASAVEAKNLYAQIEKGR